MSTITPFRRPPPKRKQAVISVDVDDINEKVVAVIDSLRGESMSPVVVKSKDAEHFFVNLEKKDFSQQVQGNCMCCNMQVTHA